jgi:hypothetical protein
MVLPYLHCGFGEKPDEILVTLARIREIVSFGGGGGREISHTEALRHGEGRNHESNELDESGR